MKSITGAIHHSYKQWHAAVYDACRFYLRVYEAMKWREESCWVLKTCNNILCSPFEGIDFNLSHELKSQWCSCHSLAGAQEKGMCSQEVRGGIVASFFQLQRRYPIMGVREICIRKGADSAVLQVCYSAPWCCICNSSKKCLRLLLRARKESCLMVWAALVHIKWAACTSGKKTPSMLKGISRF